VIPTRILLPSFPRKKNVFNPHKAALKTRTRRVTDPAQGGSKDPHKAALANPALQIYSSRVGIQWKVPQEKEKT
jgi:hypothetical protein